MSYKIDVSARFEKEIKKLIKKFPSLKDECSALISTLKEFPGQGIPIGNNCYKIWLAIASNNKGKSGGAGVITYVYVEGETVFLLSIYSKSDKENISDKEITAILNSLK